MNTTESPENNGPTPLLGLGSSAGLGPLPKPTVSTAHHQDGWGIPAYTAAQMRAYAAEQVAAERERCARMCESNDANDDYDPGSFYAYLIRGET